MSIGLEALNNPNFHIIIGRAHSGTRLIPEAMQKVGVYFGVPLNIASDLLPSEPIYAACRLFGPYVDYKKNFNWDFTRAYESEIPQEFIDLLTTYLKPLIESKSDKKGWKIPNSNLIYPWLVRLFPEATFIHWMRHPETSCNKMTGVDRLEKWNIPCKKYLLHEFNFKMRAASWKYHFDIVEDTPRPKNFLRLRFEDYINDHVKTMGVIEQKIGLKLEHLHLNPKKAVPLMKKYDKRFPFIKKALSEMNYI